MKDFLKLILALTILTQCCVGSPVNSSIQESKEIPCTKVEGAKCKQVGKFAVAGDCTKYQNCIQGQGGQIIPHTVYCQKEFYFNGDVCVHNENNSMDCDKLNLCEPIKFDSSEGLKGANETTPNPSAIPSTVSNNSVHAIFPIKILNKNESLWSVTNDMIRKMMSVKSTKKNVTMTVKGKKATEEKKPKIQDPPLDVSVMAGGDGENKYGKMKSVMDIQLDIENKVNDTDIFIDNEEDVANDSSADSGKIRPDIKLPPEVRTFEVQEDDQPLSGTQGLSKSDNHPGDKNNSSMMNSGGQKKAVNAGIICLLFVFILLILNVLNTPRFCFFSQIHTMVDSIA